jgi:hypothetical protein
MTSDVSDVERSETEAHKRSQKMCVSTSSHMTIKLIQVNKPYL